MHHCCGQIFVNNRKLPAILLITALSAVTFISGCQSIGSPQITFESVPDYPYDQPDDEDANQLSKPIHKPRTWFEAYVQATTLTEAERHARLVAVNVLLSQPDQNQTDLTLEQATLLGVNSAPQEHWSLAKEALAAVTGIDPDTDVWRYKNWLEKELDLRLNQASLMASLKRKTVRQAALIKQLETKATELNSRIEDLNGQINALTNLEQDLTDKKSDNSFTPNLED